MVKMTKDEYFTFTNNLHGLFDYLTSTQIAEIIEMLNKNFKAFKNMPDDEWKKQVYLTLGKHTSRGESISY
jgi:O-methyltransferase involved in polyketide biosynthesis